jgi:hypothetical protein|tara:strand:+ start:999 stop:1280 length:282 start_codon:yes stop_codon:yes gene_type:complete
MAQNSDSLYRNTQIIDNKYLDILDPVIDSTDNYTIKEVTISNKYNNRPDLLANELYGNSKLWWVFAEFNPDTLNDPIVDFVAGLKIKVPTSFT